MPDTDEPPDLTELDTGDHNVTVYYRSERSGNEVSRTGEVTTTTTGENGPLYWVHTEQRDTLKHQYVVLSDAETKGGDTAVIAQSVTVEADQPNEGEPPAPGRSFTVHFTVERTSFLGVVDRVMKNGVNINYL